MTVDLEKRVVCGLRWRAGRPEAETAIVNHVCIREIDHDPNFVEHHCSCGAESQTAGP